MSLLDYLGIIKEEPREPVNSRELNLQGIFLNRIYETLFDMPHTKIYSVDGEIKMQIQESIGYSGLSVNGRAVSRLTFPAYILGADYPFKGYNIGPLNEGDYRLVNLFEGYKNTSVAITAMNLPSIDSQVSDLKRNIKENEKKVIDLTLLMGMYCPKERDFIFERIAQLF